MTAHSITLSSLMLDIERQLTSCYPDPILRTQCSWWMLEAITGCSQAQLIAQGTITLTDAQQDQLRTWIHRQSVEHIPLQYLLGTTPFLDLTIAVRHPILIPRPETEEWVSNLIDAYAPYKDLQLRILDLCTGSGCVALALAKAFPASQVYATDISDNALALAQENATRNAITNITFIQSDVYAQLPDTASFDLIVSNPPYISSQEWQELDPSVKEWEDYQALVAADNGLAIIKKIIDQAHIWLNPNTIATNIPHLVIEIGYLQGNAVEKLMQDAGFCNVAIVADSAGKPRIARGRVCDVRKIKS